MEALTSTPEQTLTLYRVSEDAFPIQPASPAREWMDSTPGRFAYRCLPMTIANSSGWEIICPFAFEATWDGGAGKESLTIRFLDEVADTEQVSSHFGSGVLTFRIGYVFKTASGWATWVKGLPNEVIDGIQPLEGLIETDWLPFTFTMNWKFTRPGTIRFERGAAVAFFMIVPYGGDGPRPVIREISENPEWESSFRQWAEQRRDFNAALAESDPAALKKGWQKTYFHGQTIEGEKAIDHHVSRRRLQGVVRSCGSDAFEQTERGSIYPHWAPGGYSEVGMRSSDYKIRLRKVRFEGG